MREGLALALRAEQALLGALLSVPAEQAHLLTLIEAEDMTRPYHGQVLAAMQRLWERGVPPGPLAVHEEVIKDPEMPRSLSHDGVPLAGLMEAAPQPGHAPAYAAMVIGSGIRRRVWLAAGRMSQAAEMGDLDAALRMTGRTRQELDRCRARWAALPPQIRREIPARARDQHGYNEIAWQLRGIREEIRRLRHWPGPDPHLLEQRLGLIAHQLATVAAASAGLRERQAHGQAMGEARPSGPAAEAAGAQALRDLVAAPACLPSVREWL